MRLIRNSIRPLLLPFAALLLLGAASTACSSAEKSLKKGDEAFALGEYEMAANHYRKAYSRTPPKERARRGDIALRQAVAYRKYGNVARAVGSYQTAVRYGLTDTITYLHLGDVLRQMASYKAAAQAYEAYLDAHPGDSAALLGLKSAQEAPAIKQRGSAYTVKLEKQFSSSRADYCPALWGEDKDQQLYFSSNRSQAVGDELSNITGQRNCDIFCVKKDEKGKWKPVETIEGDLNTAYDEGACSFSPDGKTMYLTVCPTHPQYPRMAEVWTSQRGDAAWSKPQKMEITADTLSSYAHPAVSPDGRWLYFTSDMPGGYGGTDIWRVRIGEHGQGGVENLGADINTPGDEKFPAFRPNGELYFSSDGRGGLGGLDLYRATEDTLRHRWNVQPLPYPMNSNGDDFGITFDGLHNRGYFSSSRSTGGRGWDKIYSFSYPEHLKTVKGWVYEQDGYELPDAQVYMIGSDGTNLKFGVRSDGSFEQPVTSGVEYLFLATCKGFLNCREELRPDSVEEERQYVLQFPLPSISVPVLVRNVFYEFDKADITENSAAALDRLTTLLKENPNITIELAAHCDNRGNDDYNLRLSQRRAESVVRYLTEHGVEADRLTPKGYGEHVPKIVNRKLLETYPFLHENDTLTEAYILRLSPEEQEICHALNRRTEFRVLRTTYGLFDEQGRLKPEALKPREADREAADE
ncbi:MAG: OmpA family protein [Alloprevotella sp.]